MLKKIYRWLIALFGIGAGVVVCRSLTGRLASAREQLGVLRDELREAAGQVQGIREEQRAAEWLCTDLEGVIEDQSRVLDSVESKLREDQSVLDESERELSEAVRIIGNCKKIIEKYTTGTDNSKNN